MLGWIVGALVIAAVYLLIVALIARSSLWPPRVPLFFSPGVTGVEQEDVELRTHDGLRVAGWWIHPQGDSPVVCVLAHGYLMNRSELAPVAVRLAQKGISSLAIDFRCHGDSERAKTGVGYREKAEVIAACEWIRAQRPEAKIVLIGSSMGSVASAFAMADRPELADGLVLDSAYSRLDRTTRDWWSSMGGPVLKALMAPLNLVFKPIAGFDPKTVDVTQALGKIDRPVLILHGTRDQIASPDQAERNFAACKGPAQLVWFDGAKHSEGRCAEPSKYSEVVENFLAEIGNMARDQRRSLVP